MTDLRPQMMTSLTDTKLFIDIETFSSVSIDNGVYAYTQSPDFNILLFAYSVDGDEVKVVDLKHGEQIPQDILSMLSDEGVEKHAFNAMFERVCLSRFSKTNPAGKFLMPQQWRCTMVECAYNGLPMSLKEAGAVLGITDQKMDEGKALIKKYCTPGKYNNVLADDPDWQMFKKYNKRDVEAEIQIHNALRHEVPFTVWNEYALDQCINDMGVLIDTQLVNGAISINNVITKEYYDKLKQLTGLDNPKSVTQLKTWLSDKGIETDSLDKKAVGELMKSVPDNIREVLYLKSLLSKSSIKKYETMLDVKGADDRVRGCFQFYGSHTGRFAGRLVQLQNLPQNHIQPLTDIRTLVREEKTEALECLYDNIPQLLSELIRTAIIPKKGCRLYVADFSAIEARVIAWLAGEQWKTEAFAAGKDLYCATASAMFGVPVEKNGVNGHLRQKGKIAELACGYSGSVGALKAFGAVEMGIKENELQTIVDNWRSANPQIVKLWRDVESAAKKAICRKDSSFDLKVGNGSVKIGRVRNDLVIQLPSKRRLYYCSPSIGTNKFGGESVTYMGVNSVRKWSKIETNGGRLVENIVQAIARDLLCEAMIRLSQKYDIIAHVHDEVIIEHTPKDGTLDDIIHIMCELPEWAAGMILNAAGFESDYYMKD